MSKSTLAGGALTAAFVLAVGGVTVGPTLVYVAQPDTTVRITVDSKQNVVQDRDSKYLIFTTNSDGSAGEVFQNSDSWTRGKFNSSDVQAKLKEGCTYDARVFGYRLPFLSQYRNIVDASPVSTPQCPVKGAPSV